MGKPLNTALSLSDAAATESLGARLAEVLPADTSGWLVLLQGELGSGKSTLARALLKALGHEGAVPSPTYTLVEPYDLRSGTAYHVDLYRISDESELPFLGWTELREGLVLLEWPERSPALFELADLHIRLGFPEAPGDIGEADPIGRVAELLAVTERGSALLRKLAGQAR
ncbi:MAG: tRNA (adenosine(37)-N6)-threonylcarbamoyltransferase complex ATPase subunit type 1 TsaE [Woeseia sp.]